MSVTFPEKIHPSEEAFWDAIGVAVAYHGHLGAAVDKIAMAIEGVVSGAIYGAGAGDALDRAIAEAGGGF